MNWKMKFYPTFNEKKIGSDVAILIKNDTNSVFVNNNQYNDEAIWNLVEINGKQTLMGKEYIH